jgi:tetratricopeptide (TPR) repeat protein
MSFPEKSVSPNAARLCSHHRQPCPDRDAGIRRSDAGRRRHGLPPASARPPETRQDACERVIAAGQAAAKDLAIAFAVRGNVLFNKRNIDKAIEAYGKALEIDPDNVGILNSRGWAYMAKGQDDPAMADYNAALQKRPKFAIVYNNRGLLYLRKGALQSALDDFNSALNYAPNMYYVHANRGRVLAMTNDFDGALRRRDARIFSLQQGNDASARQRQSVIPGRCESIEPGISRLGVALRVRRPQPRANRGPRIGSAPRREVHSASKTRVNALMALRSIRGTLTSRHGPPVRG